MACAFCHVGPNPLKPPADPDNPKWENLSSNVGAQYFWFNRIFAWQADQSSFLFQALSTYRPGALDTSLVSTDYIDNPRTMNAIYYLGPRLELGKRWGHETLAGANTLNKQLNDFFPTGALAQYFEPPANVWNPRVLKDGADSVGVMGALNRVYINIGLYSEEWLRHFNALFGGEKTSPIEIAVARENSTYWNVTEAWTPAMADFFLNSTEPHHLADAPGGAQYLAGDEAQLTRGKQVFAERCARCHSSKAPAPADGVDPGGCSGKDYLGCWKRYWAWTKTDAYKAQMREIVMKPDFLDKNFLSTELRVPDTLLQTNACSPLASNAIGGSIWDNFSSQTYKDLPSVGEITYYHPVTGEARKYAMPAGGRGYTRPASLVSLWSTAPFLLNNTVGRFDTDPSVAARMKSFDDAIEQMLWPEKRAKDPLVGAKIPGPSLIDRTTEDSYIKIPTGFLPGAFADFLKLPFVKDKDGLKIGPIPKGTPIGLLANLDLDPGEHLSLGDRLKRDATVVELVKLGKADLLTGRGLENLVDPLLKLSKCPDLIVNRGHYFGTDMLDAAEGEPGLSDSDKKALIGFLKRF
jgi:cytochrome c2